MSSPNAIATVLYPAGLPFDLPYYLTKHMPMVAATWTPLGLTSWKVARHEAADAQFQVSCTMEFRDAAALQAALTSEANAAVMQDIVNFTEATPVLVGGEVVGGS